MIANEMGDEVDSLDVTGLDRAELIQQIRELERQRSAWELRVRACQERESLYLSFVNDMGLLLAETYQQFHDGITVKANKAEVLMQTIQSVIREVEKV